ncbi:DUF433 domain-containing protein [Fibrella forsythiae]|uniref:DUF433 domain-containing protein n=1 Tax=Fibrella forsythiae TaxID=2817061 RepID=A0ABS3JNM2_9BACT|nr:DUF433 domain-containing protein [Fibrella forsythiae]
MGYLLNRNTFSPNICYGKPVAHELRFTGETIPELIASAMTRYEILAAYENLGEQDLLACLFSPLS